MLGGYGWDSRDYIHDDAWKFNPESFTWKEIKPKGEMQMMHYQCYAMVGDRVFFWAEDFGLLEILDLSPSLKTLSKLAVFEYNLEKSELTHDIQWELRAMCSKGDVPSDSLL